MTQNSNDAFDPLDPIGAWRTVRDANLDAWAKSMSNFTGTEAFAKAIGVQLDTMLAASGPMQQAFQQYMERYLAQANMPSRHEVVSLAERLTNVEMRLDDMQAQLDDILSAVQQSPASGVPTSNGPSLTGLQNQLNSILSAIQNLSPEAGDDEGAAAKPTRSRRARKTDDEG